MGTGSPEPQRGRPRRSGGLARPKEVARDTHLYAEIYQQPEREVHADDSRIAGEAGERPKNHQRKTWLTGAVRDGVAADHASNWLSKRKACRQEMPSTTGPKTRHSHKTDIRESRQRGMERATDLQVAYQNRLQNKDWQKTLTRQSIFNSTKHLL